MAASITHVVTAAGFTAAANSADDTGLIISFGGFDEIVDDDLETSILVWESRIVSEFYQELDAPDTVANMQSSIPEGSAFEAISLLCYHRGRPPYRIVLDMIGPPQCQLPKVAMFSNWHMEITRTDWHGAWHRFPDGSFRILFRWFWTFEHQDRIELRQIDLEPAFDRRNRTFRDSYATLDGRIIALRLYEFEAPERDSNFDFVQRMNDMI